MAGNRAADDKNGKLAYLLGSLYGDGCFSHADRNGRIHFGSTDKEFTEKLANIISDIFTIFINLHVSKLSLKNNKWKDFYYFSSRKLYRHIGYYDWKLHKKLPDFIKHGKSKTQAAFIRGFFDAEGSVDINSFRRKDGRTQITRHVKCFSNDVEILKEIKFLLTKFKIQSNIFQSKKTNHCLVIWNYSSLISYQKYIGFYLKRKDKRLENAIKTYKKIQTRWTLETYEKVMNLRNQGLGPRRISKKLNSGNIKIPLPTIEFWIYRHGKPLNGGTINGIQDRKLIAST